MSELISALKSNFAGNEPLLWVIPTCVKRWINDINPLVYQYWIALRDDDSLEDRWVKHCKRADRSLTDAYHLFRSCCKRLMTGNHHPVDLNRCRHGMKTRWSRWRYDRRNVQCSRKPVEDIEGFKFCAQHAKIMKSKFGLFGYKLEETNVRKTT